MKKKILYVIGVILLCLILTSAIAISSTNVIKGKLTASTQEIKAGQDVMITLRFDQYNQITKGINAFKATLEYDDEIFETITQENFKTLNNWEELRYNSGTKELVAIKKNVSKQPEDIIQINLTAKVNPKLEKTKIGITNIYTSEGREDIILDNEAIEINVVAEQPSEEQLKSEKYNVTEGYVSRVLPKTTIKEFNKNIEIENSTEQTKVEFTDKKGNVLQEDSNIATGTKLQIGEKTYEIIVTGDTDGDSLITVNDMATLKLHMLGIQVLKGIEYEAANMNENELLDVDDLAKMKLIYLGLKVLE